MLKNPRGVILVMTKARFEEVRHELAEKNAFIESLPMSRFSGPAKALAAIIIDGIIVAAAAFHAIGHQATGLRRVRIHSFVFLNVPLEAALKALHQGFTAYAHKIKDNIHATGGLVPEDIWPVFWTALRSSTTAKHALDALEYSVFHAEDAMTTPAAELHRLERDAIGLASEMAGFNRGEILGLFPLPTPPIPSPAIQTLTQRTAIEDTFISYDARKFPYFKNTIIDDPNGCVTLSNKKGERLHILNVNRTKTETATGADLIYLAESFSSAILVQYKLFNYDDHPERKSVKAYYRLGEDDDKQLQKLQQIKLALETPDMQRLQDYRLGAECVFYKLCHRCPPDSQSDLVPGIYFSVDHWERLLRDKISVGVRGAQRAIGYENSDRHLNNTEFTSLVRSGWIGSRATPPERLQQIIDDLLGAKRSVTVAYKENVVSSSLDVSSAHGRSRGAKSHKNKS